MMLFTLLVHSKSWLRTFLSPLWNHMYVRRLLRDRATRDTEQPEVQSVSEPESLHGCVLSWGLVGKRRADFVVGTSAVL